MAFASLGNNAGGGASTGQDLETIQTEALGFLSVAGDAKLRLTSPWSPLPSSTASLLSIASRQGLVAAAGPDQIVLAKTDAVRKGLEAPKDGDSDIRSFEPQLKISMPMRVSQLAFTADEQYLILSAETGGGLAVYEVQSLLQGSTNSAFELSTNGETLRALVPNPTPEKAGLCAIVTNNGNLHMASLQDRAISSPLKSQVSCVSWSSKGKQLCAGLADGSIQQMTPEGEAKAEIPKPPGLGDYHVSTLFWLENHLFLSIHCSTNESPPSSVYSIITRSSSSFTFQKITDPVEPFGSEKTPHHSVLRLRNFPPALSDLLIIASTASTEVGLLSRSETPLGTDKSATSTTNVFTTTELLDDTKRPTLPMTDSMDDSTPVGFALDLSSHEKVYKPIPSEEELEESPGPLPGLWILTHEGVLCPWWVVYTDSVMKGTTYPGLAAVEGSAPAAAAAAAAPAAAPQASPSPFGQSSASAFGSAAAPAPAFGASSQLGQKQSPWATSSSSNAQTSSGGGIFGSANKGTGSSAFGSSASPNPFGNTSQSSPFAAAAASSAPAFGQPSAFGQAAGLGSKASPWGSSGTSGTGGAAFGQSGFASAAKTENKSPFWTAGDASKPATTAASGGFAGFANKSGFAGLGSGDNASQNKDNPFANTSGSAFGSGGSTFGSGGSLFGSSKPTTSIFGSANTTSTTTSTTKEETKSTGGVFGSGPFKLQSSFKPDTSGHDDSSQANDARGPSMMGDFGSALEETRDKADMSSPPQKSDQGTVMESVEKTPQAKSSSLFPSQTTPESTTPTTTPAPSKFGFATSPIPGTSLFGQPTKLDGSVGQPLGTPADQSKASPFGSLFGQTPKSTQSWGKQQEPETPQIKVEEEEEAPLPPDTTTTTGFSQPEAAPLPPDFTAKPKTAKPADDAPLPPDFVNVAKPSQKQKEAEDAPLPPDPVKLAKSSVPDAPLPPDPVEPKSSFKKADSGSSYEFVPPKVPSKEPSTIPSIPDSGEEDDDDVEEEEEEEGSGSGSGSEDEDDNVTEGSGVDVTKELSPSQAELTHTPGYTPQSSFGGIGAKTPSTAQPEQGRARPLFGEVSRDAPVFARPNEQSPRSPSPIRGAVPNRVFRSDARSVSAPGMASQILGPRQSQSHMAGSIVGRDRIGAGEDSFMAQHRKLRARQEAEETQPLVDEEDDDIQKILSSEVEGTLALDEFIAHSNVSPPAKDSITSQVEAVYRDINSMIDTLGLNARAVKAFTKGNMEHAKQDGRTEEDLEIPDDWVLCEIGELGEVLDNDLAPSLEDSRVRDLDDKLDVCQDLSRDMHRLRARQEDLRRIIMARMDPDQSGMTQTLPLSAEQATQQNELRRDFTNFTKLLADAEEALTLLRARIASSSGAAGRGSGNVPTVDAVMRTITKMTSMVEKRSGDIDVLETQLRQLRLGSRSREGSPMMTPQGRKSVMFSPETTPARNLRQSLSSSAFGSPPKATPPRKKLSGFSREEKGELMEKRGRRQAVLDKLRTNVEKRGVHVWNMEDIE